MPKEDKQYPIRFNQTELKGIESNSRGGGTHWSVRAPLTLQTWTAGQVEMVDSAMRCYR